MNQERQMSVFLGGTRFWITALVIFNCAVLVVQCYDVASQFFDTCGSRADCGGACFDYWRIMGAPAFGYIVPAVVYWTQYHVMYAAYFWLGFLTAVAGLIWYVVQAILMISDIIDCDATVWCYACTTLLSDVPKDPAFIINLCCCLVMAILCFIYAFVIGGLRNRTEFGFFWWLATEQKVNDRVPYIPTPFAYGHTDNPTGQSANEFESRRWFRRARFVATILCIIHLCAFIVMQWNFGNLLIDVCNMRAFSWTYIRLFSNVLGVISVFTGYWYLWHLIYEFWHLLTIVVCFVVGSWHLFTWLWMLTKDLPNCNTVSYCFGCPLTPGTTDWPFTLFLWMLGVCWVCSYLYIPLVWLFRRKIGEIMNMEALASPNYPGGGAYVPLVSRQIGAPIQRGPGHLSHVYALPVTALSGYDAVTGLDFEPEKSV